jgi:hypothetical protein
VSNAVERLKWLCSPDAERLSDYERINQFVKAGLDVSRECLVNSPDTMPMTDKLVDAIELVRIGAGRAGYRSYPGTGGVWAGANGGIADAVFEDWGLARATAEILNAALDGRLSAVDQIETLAEIERLRSAIEAIRQATIEGRVCDDTAWYDSITTLYDFCDQILAPRSS